MTATHVPKVLIANRGEIACRAIRTLKHMRLRSVAIYSAADVQSLHVLLADEALSLGDGNAKETYLDVDRVLRLAQQAGAAAIFPGYGFLSENAEFAGRAGEAGIAFVGPTPEQLSAFGLKHRARQLAEAAKVPLLPGSELLTSLSEAKKEAARIGYPVMLKSTAGGGGIGLNLCESEVELDSVFDSAIRLGESNFAQAGVFLEKYVQNARHIEVQIFGDGKGKVIALGERDCSAQRRNQKVIEETPAPELGAELRQQLASSAVRLAESINYLSAGTVEYIFDSDTNEFYFLEVNTRLQVEHGVTEAVTGVDLVEWMILTALGKPPALEVPKPRGHAMQARIYAENPASDFRPSSGLLTDVSFPDATQARVDTWVDTGVVVSPLYDPMIAKVIVHAEDRKAAILKMQAALRQVRIAGVATNVSYLREIFDQAEFQAGAITTHYLKQTQAVPRGIEVLKAGTFSTVQDFPGRIGYWNVGIPPSGPMDSLSMRLGNRAVGNSAGAAALEMTISGDTLRFNEGSTIALAGASMAAELDGTSIPFYEPVPVRAGQTLRLGKVNGPGVRTYLCVRNGIQVPEYLGSRSTFTLGKFGGFGGRTLRPGDQLELASDSAVDEPQAIPDGLQPQLQTRWDIAVNYGPHGAPDYFKPGDIQTLFETEWEVHYNSARTGVRLIGPKPEWARPDGGEAGLHPSNIHDNAYAFGTIDFTGDMPILLGPDGPSLGGFVCPATIVTSDLWKMGQLKPGDQLRFKPVSRATALEWQLNQERAVEERKATGAVTRTASDFLKPNELSQPIPTLLGNARGSRTPQEAGNDSHDFASPAVAYRPAGDQFLLIEYGPQVLDLRLRFRVSALMAWVEAAKLPGVIELTPGIRSLQIHYDPRVVKVETLIQQLQAAEAELPDVAQMRVPTRVVHLPLSWDDESTQLAIRKYTQLVRKDAPWAPSNIEFIRRINGLPSIDDVKRIVFDASYLVLGLGDVYLGAPVATPVDPRHRLVTTKYNPARTWTPENAVGIGGAYLCVYGMEGPGGYQFVGRTVPVFGRFRQTDNFEPNKPWLLRFFDQIRFFPVSGKQLLELRDEFAAGRYVVKTEEETFDLGEYQNFLKREHTSITDFKSRQQAAFEQERERWIANGQLNFDEDEHSGPNNTDAIADGQEAVSSPAPGSVWKLNVAVGDTVNAGQTVAVLESMKMEMAVEAPCSGRLVEWRCEEGSRIEAGQTLAVLQADN